MTDEIENEPDSPFVVEVSGSRRQIRAAFFWSGIVVSLFVFYFICAPAPFFLAYNRGWFDGDSLLAHVLTYFFKPAEWLSENSELYQSYIRWLRQL